ncbi:MAG: hypothetical protein JSR99_15335 [Proteobacteria bacterium]|nr:hypothetical protein [Pseudomonadota bacterium]
MKDPRTLSYSDVVRQCDKLKARLAEFESIKKDHDFYQYLRDNFDKIKGDVSPAQDEKGDEFVPDLKTQKGIAYTIIKAHPEGISQEGIIAEFPKYGMTVKASSLSSQLSALKKKHLIKKVRRLFMIKK